MKVSILGLAVAAGLAVVANGATHATTITVNATDNIYQVAGNTEGTSPSSISVSGGDPLTFDVSGSVIVNVGTGDNTNDADGVGSASGLTSTGYGSLSGISASSAGFLVGVFVPPGGPSGAAPTALNFAGATSFSSLSPLLNQVFFIGDGLTGDSSGSAQTFVAPTGAASLYLGLADACSYNGPPGCFNDNTGTFTVNALGSVAATPLPPAWPLFVSGVAFLGIVVSRRKQISGDRSWKQA